MVESDIILPGRDMACLEVVQYLTEQINAEYAQIVSGGIAIQKYVDWDAWNSSTAEFPLLTMHRIKDEGEGLDHCEGAITYYLGSMSEMEEFAGNLRWVATRIVRSLYKFNRLGQFRAVFNLDFRAEYGTVINGQCPFVRVFVDFVETGV
jgi:hypothetical protein